MPENVLESAASFAERLRPGDLDVTLEAVTAAAVALIADADFASISVRHRDRIETVHATDDVVLPLDEQQYVMQEGPCYAAATDVAQIVAPDLESDPRFTRYGPVAVASGIQAQAAFRLFDHGDTSGALNLYATRRGAFEDLGTTAALFRSQAGIAIAYAYEITNLQEALETRTTIGQAMGIVMERYGLNDERAFAFLTRLSQHRNVKLRLVADEIVAEAAGGSAAGEATSETAV